jgi:ribonuclease T2
MRHLVSVLALLLGAAAAQAEGEAAGDFDYFVMALSWSSAWCALEGDARDDPQCDAGRGLSFTLHGLWPQDEPSGWPSYCQTVERDPSRAESEAMADIMGGSGLAWYQWKKHGRCAGFSAPDYYAMMRRAYASVTIPPVFSRIDRDLTIDALIVEEAFLESNPQLVRDQVTVTCKSGLIQEVRICLTPELEPRRCGADVIRDCTLTNAVLEAVR